VLEAYNAMEVKNCYEKTATEYAAAFSNELAGKPLDRLLIQRFVSELVPGPVVEFGAGSGHIAQYASELSGSVILATDICYASIDLGKSLYPKLRFMQCDMLASGLEASSYSGVLCFYGTVHFDYPQIFLAMSEWYKLLIPGGLLLWAFHVGQDESLRAQNFLSVPGACATWNLPIAEKILAEAQRLGFERREALERWPYEGIEHPSKRCYLLLAKPE
jgi:ubiquinone/menaquinone biosynthesis C-methylase UbiE